MATRGRGRRGRPRGASQAPPVFDQQAFIEAVGSAAVVIAQASATGSQGGVDDIRSIQDMGAGTKRKEDPSSSNRERSRRLLFHKDIQDRAKVIRTKARMGHLVRQGR